MTTPDDDEIMCDCSGTRKSKILEWVDKGVDTLDGLSRKTGAVSGCGACEFDIQDFLDEIDNTKST